MKTAQHVTTNTFSTQSTLLSRNQGAAASKKNIVPQEMSQLKTGHYYALLSFAVDLAPLLTRSLQDPIGWKDLLTSHYLNQEDFKTAANNFANATTVSETVSKPLKYSMPELYAIIMTKGDRFLAQPQVQQQITEHIDFLKRQMMGCYQHEVEELSRERQFWERQVITGQGLKALLKDA